MKFSCFSKVSPLALVVALAGCGRGGGGGSDDDSASNNTPDNACFKTFEGSCLTNAELAEAARQLTVVVRNEWHEQVDDSWGHNPDFASALKWPYELVNAYEGLTYLVLAYGEDAYDYWHHEK